MTTHPQPNPEFVRGLRRELARRNDYLERIAEAANNPDCYQCAEVRRLAHEALQPPPPAADDWAT